MKARFHQSGSVASFIIIGVVLVLVTVGVLYWVRHKDAPVARNDTPTVSAPATKKATPKEEKSTDTKETAPPAASSTTPSTAPETTPAPAPTVATLSQTGPTDTALEVIAIGALVATIAGFARSRKLRSSL